ncbi:MAG: MepB family protein [Kofleriaceae bacterium]
MFRVPTPELSADRTDEVEAAACRVGLDGRAVRVQPARARGPGRPVAGGKRAIRVYPPWVTLAAKEAIRTQRWQVTCFLPLGPSGAADPVLVRKRFQA